MEKPMTPKGVEHAVDVVRIHGGEVVEKPMTPKGVEHTNGVTPAKTPGVPGEADDAERR